MRGKSKSFIKALLKAFGGGKMKLKFAVIGCGRMGQRRIRTIVNHPDAELACVIDADSDIARKVAREYGCDYYSDVEKGINRADVEYVVICTPNKFHVDIALKALAKGKHVLCEKPLARNPEEAKKMVKASLENGVTLKVSSNLRYFPSVQKAKELLDKSVIGDLLFIRGWIGNSGWQLSKPWFTDHDLIGGGTLLDNGSHLLDIYRWFLGEVEECFGYTSRMYHNIDSSLEDNAFGVFKFMNGKYALIQSSWTEWEEYMYMEIYGTEGYIKVDNRMPNCKVIYGNKDGYQEVYDYSKLPPQSYDIELREYINGIRNDSYPEPTGFDGLRAVQMVYGIYESAKSGKRVKIWGKEEEELFNLFLREVRNRE